MLEVYVLIDNMINQYNINKFKVKSMESISEQSKKILAPT